VTIAIVWFRRDLRLADHPALAAACRQAKRLIPLYLWAPDDESPWQPGAASRWWLHQSLETLDRALTEHGTRLIVHKAHQALPALQRLVRKHRVTHLYWNRLYDPATVSRDRAVKAWADEAGLTVESFPAGLLVEPWAVATGKEQPYRVFTPFWKAARQIPVDKPLPPPEQLPPLPEGVAGVAVADLRLKPRIPWDAGLAERWEPGESAAHDALEAFVREGADSYAGLRDLPAHHGTSRLSPYLHHGELSPRQAHHLLSRTTDSSDAQAWLRQLYWREFGHHLLFHFPETAEQPLDPRFEAFPWETDGAAALAAWQRGRTGIPIVDAGMRELWETGWMHNRVRMIVASLLTKNLLISWQEGSRWFWDTLVDADLANNTLGWQWTAGCGADAAPFFRIFNPILQAERFDPDGAYVRRWVPELKALPDKWLNRPWEAPRETLARAGIELVRHYPQPLVDLKASRNRALAAWDQIKRSG
jgi:deoxyribodipyrimidine photo-lyase